jgi:hypothetical protein
MSLHNHALGPQDREAGALPGQLRGLSHIDRLGRLRDVHRLVAHGGEDLSAEPFIVREAGHGEGLDEVALRQALHLQVVGLPSGQLR